MKKITILLSSIILFAACNKSVDKKTELATLKADAKEINAKIAALEKELGAGKESSSTKVIAVTVTPIAPVAFKHFVEAQGNVVAENTVLVSPQTGGMIVSLPVVAGQQVSKGQLIATLDNSILKESMEEVKHQLELSKTLFEKQKTLWDQQIGTEVQYLSAKSNKESLEKRLVTLRAQLGLSRVVAPISGTVEIVRQKAGEMGAPGMPIVQIVNLGNLKISAKIADAYVGSVKQGDPINIKFPDINKEITARISLVSKMVNPLTRTFDIEARIPNAGGDLKPNQLAVININDLSKANALVVDENIIQKTEKGNLVYVAVEENGKKVAKARIITIGLTYNGQAEIATGLQAGDLIITQGYQDLVDGQAISF
ncbi:efflux RND transporter periplasmic adaptor subunit [Aquirufa regiilacus]|uniref:Efflux RND transporter periplasmic adaptor subunit n=1 Tax=Aquirufa regiilacus TaxID=3024868 RepID=A0ABU3TS35_9BACT|nr:efflux RND transporter periplasmic adaptor subunit [Aquirufa sp. LEOWEIH-7C]MDU0808691.1 efflux RND transporter periplasmic adaptor subunit [Aquirufa sp. LEOWEIH-7C]